MTRLIRRPDPWVIARDIATKGTVAGLALC
ncbi:Uncharacterised protein [Mycobacterium tuberculosis]|nr:Uncharacterised protein [Mycobacterium tuberculosis]